MKRKYYYPLIAIESAINKNYKYISKLLKKEEALLGLFILLEEIVEDNFNMQDNKFFYFLYSHINSAIKKIDRHIFFLAKKTYKLTTKYFLLHKKMLALGE
jgi:hypothetical protein